MRFTKMEGLGNDFVVVGSDALMDSEIVRSVCNRHFGVGADGVLQVGVANSEIVMDYWNADGSKAEMCGNGLRCVAIYARDKALVHSEEFTVMTPVGARQVFAYDWPKVELGPVTVGDLFAWDGLAFHRASVGNPHAVTIVDDIKKVDVTGIGQALEAATPAGLNVGFVQIESDRRLRLRVWERGSGETLACGSGMAAAAAVAHHLGLVAHAVEVEVRGGTATIELTDDTSWLTGPARVVFEGEI